MQHQIVLVRADCGKPVRLVAVQASDGLIFVSSERAAADPDSGFPPPIGVPASDVFPYDEQAFARLVLEWETTGKVDSSSWNKLSATKEAAN
jgi:hypothetical protein